jgi:prepilin-type N-terminal cleavage/methylation domain-containing protein
MKKGFTLIELLIVIAILAVLATAVILVLNPAELIKQARDSTRISDMSTLNSAIALFLSDQASSTWSSIVNCTSGTTAPSSTTSVACTTNGAMSIDNTGWVPINFNSITTGAPLSRLPIDPNNGSSNCAGTVVSNCFYVYMSAVAAGKYKLMANMESSKYTMNGSADVESKDGGTTPDWYEIGGAVKDF